MSRTQGNVAAVLVGVWIVHPLVISLNGVQPFGHPFAVLWLTYPLWLPPAALLTFWAVELFALIVHQMYLKCSGGEAQSRQRLDNARNYDETGYGDVSGPCRRGQVLRADLERGTVFVPPRSPVPPQAAQARQVPCDLWRQDRRKRLFGR